MRVLVTGAGGFVGGHLVAALRDRHGAGAAVASGTCAAEGVEPLDVTDAEACARLIADRQPTHIVHLAAISAIGEAEADPGRAWAVNLHGTLNLARAAKAADCRFAFVSTSEIYAGSVVAGELVTERALPAPRNLYAASKAAADLAVGALAAQGLRAIRLRPFNHTGPGQQPRFVVPAFAAQIAAIERTGKAGVLRTGRLDTSRDFLDVRDVVAAYIAALERFDSLLPGAILNISSGVARRMEEVVAIMVRLARVPVTVEPDPARMRPADTPWLAGDPTLAKGLLGWAPRIGFETTIADVLDAARAA